jgi:putative heme-binding domain-containing protein
MFLARSWVIAAMVRTLIVTLLLAASVALAQDPDPAQRSKDALKVKALVRLKQFNLEGKPELKAAVVRHLETVRGTAQYLELVEKFQIREAAGELARLASEATDDTLAVNAAQLLLKFDAKEAIAAALAHPDDAKAARAVTILGLTDQPQVADLLLPLVSSADHAVGIRTAAVTAVGRYPAGQQAILELVTAGKLTPELHFAAANVLLTSRDATIKAEASEHLKLPAMADAKPLPPLAELVKSTGDAQRGKQVFDTVGTCAKCHKVHGEGKEVGPDLSEIGSKLSKEAMYVSILDPNAGISFNYETHLVALDDGSQVSGIVISQTDAEVQLKTAEAIVRQLPRDQIVAMKKQTVSLMPADLQKQLRAQDVVDVVEYLTTLKKQ